VAAKTFAALRGRDYTSPDDVKALVPPVLRHRINLRPEAEVEGLDSDSVIRRILAKVGSAKMTFMAQFFQDIARC